MGRHQPSRSPRLCRWWSLPGANGWSPGFLSPQVAPNNDFPTPTPTPLVATGRTRDPSAAYGIGGSFNRGSVSARSPVGVTNRHAEVVQAVLRLSQTVHHGGSPPPLGHIMDGLFHHPFALGMPRWTRINTHPIMLRHPHKRWSDTVGARDHHCGHTINPPPPSSTTQASQHRINTLHQDGTTRDGTAPDRWCNAVRPDARPSGGGLPVPGSGPQRSVPPPPKKPGSGCGQAAERSSRPASPSSRKRFSHR